MNCLRTRNSYRRNDLALVEPSAPPHYPTQPPYNPDFINGDVQYVNYEPQVTWVSSEIQQQSENEYEDGSVYEECVEWGRRSLYEGVNCMPVSALVVCSAPHATRLRLRITHVRCHET